MRHHWKLWAGVMVLSAVLFFGVLGYRLGSTTHKQERTQKGVQTTCTAIKQLRADMIQVYEIQVNLVKKKRPLTDGETKALADIESILGNPKCEEGSST